MTPTTNPTQIERYDRAPIGLPDRAVTISHSTLIQAHCPRRYLLRRIEGLRPKRIRLAPTYGSLWHRVKEHVHRAWLQDRAPTEQEMIGAEWEAEQTLLGFVDKDQMTEEDADGLMLRLRGNLEAWLRMNRGGAPPESYRLVAYEIGLAMPIRTRSGRVYAPEVPVVRDGDVWRLARPGERSRAYVVRWPWYFVGRLDQLMAHRSSGVLWVSDDKTSASPGDMLTRLSNDPQVPGYLSLVRHASREGLLPWVPQGAEVKGFWHRITHSGKLSRPTVLKGRKKDAPSPGLSVARNRRIPSWWYRKALVEHGFDPGEDKYRDHLAYLRSHVDANLERIDWQSYGDDDLDRYDRELYAGAARLAQMHRDAVRASTVEDLDKTHPRVAVCQSSKFGCDYVGPCMNDGAEVRHDYEVRAAQTWAVDPLNPALPPGITPDTWRRP